MLAGRAAAQTFKILYSFSATTSTNSNNWPVNNDGINPTAGLLLSGNTLYGTAEFGGLGYGTVFALNIGSEVLSPLYNFTYGSDGAFPKAGVVLSGNTLYGTTSFRGGNIANVTGTVFSVNTNGSNFTTLHGFTNGSDGGSPGGGLVISGNTLYGTAYGGGANGNGTVFSVNTSGSNFMTLHSFSATALSYPYGNLDGSHPLGGLVLSGSTLYGMAYGGGRYGYGTVFAISTTGSNFTTLYSFTGPIVYGGNELILSGNILYGTTFYGGGYGDGSVFAINTNGSNFMNLHNFAGSSDGVYPDELVLSGNTVYGTAAEGGNSGNGTLFAINTNGSNFINLHNFTGSSDGEYPDGLVLSGNTLYGTAAEGGSSGNGTVFSLSFTPPLNIILSGANIVLTWPTNTAGFTLQFTTNLSPAAWSTNLPSPVVVNGQYTVTNPISGTQQFYQLSQ